MELKRADADSDPAQEPEDASTPAEIRAIYTHVSDGSVGPNALALLKHVEGLAHAPDGSPATPYDLALAMQGYLRDPANFTYATDVREAVRANCEGMSTVECFATIKTGYCEYYASTMAILLRQDGIPTRVVYGFLSGDRAPDGTEVVAAAAQHWWDEVYFPGYGWVEFDPTGGPAGHPVGQPLPIPSGGAVTETAKPLSSTTPVRSGFRDPEEPATAGGVTNRASGAGVHQKAGPQRHGRRVRVSVLEADARDDTRS